MCITFCYIAKRNGGGGSGKFIRFIIASNRDETFSRPTRNARFWESDPNILAGQDAEENGTWLGISKTGKIGCLLNIRTPDQESKKNHVKSRGELVTNFLRSSTSLGGWTYLNNLLHEPNFSIANEYNGFNLITVDLKPKNEELNSTASKETIGPDLICAHMNYINNVTTQETPMSMHLKEGEIFSFGNSVYDKPFSKVCEGSKAFKTVIDKVKAQTYCVSVKEELKTELLTFLKSSTRHYPDPEMDALMKGTNYPVQAVPYLSSIFVRIPGSDYGTRTHTIIIVDSDDNVDFTEWTLKEPIDKSKPEWVESNFQFKISSE